MNYGIVEPLRDVGVLGEDCSCELACVTILYVWFEVADEYVVWVFNEYVGVAKGDGVGDMHCGVDTLASNLVCLSIVFFF